MSVSAPAMAALPAFQASEGYWRSVLRRFLRNRLGVAAALVVLALLPVALAAPGLVALACVACACAGLVALELAAA